MTALHIAACNGHCDVVAELLGHIKVSAVDSRGSTALHVAAANLDHDMVALLLGKGADGWAANTEGWTPLLAAMGAAGLVRAAVQFELGSPHRARELMPCRSLCVHLSRGKSPPELGRELAAACCRCAMIGPAGTQ